MPDTLKRKADMRKAAAGRRAAAFARHGGKAGTRLAAAGLDRLGAPPARVVSGFGAIGEEIDPLPLMKRLAGEGYRLCLPVMQGRAQPLLFRAWSPGDPTAETIWGIREPLSTAPAVEPDVVLAALLLYDLDGYRLGYGGGHYDRSLNGLRQRKSVISIGLAYEEQRVDQVPRLDYDARLDWILTPAGLIDCRAGGSTPAAPPAGSPAPPQG